MRKSLCLLLLLGGCVSTKQIDQSVNQLTSITQVITDQISQSGILTQWQSTLSAEAINPTIVVQIDGKWVVGIEAEVRYGVEGVAGQMDTATKGVGTEDEPNEPSESMQSTGMQTIRARGVLVIDPITGKWSIDPANPLVIIGEQSDLTSIN